MQRSEAPHIEINRARKQVESMGSAASLEEFEEHWKQFLHRLERAWNKTKAHYGRSPKWGNWSASIEKMRREDPLLSYLVNARGAEEHSVNEITGRESGSIGIGFPEGVGVQPDGSIYVERLEVESDARGIHISSSLPLKLTFTPQRIRMLAVVNRGRTYPVPSSHLGLALDAANLPATADVALSFYTKALADAEAFFVK